VAELVGVDRLGGAVQQGLGVGGLLVHPPVAAVMLVAGIGVGAAGKWRDRRAAGQEGALARTARSVAALSVRVPVAVLIDDADRLDPLLAVTLVENLIERHDGWVLVVPVAAPSSRLIRELRSRARYGLTEGRVQLADADPDMGELARADLAAELCPGLPRLAARRIGQRTQTFAEVFAITSVPRLTWLGGMDAAAAVAVVDEVFDDQPVTAEPPVEAVVLAWAGGVLHARQWAAALRALAARPSGQDGAITRAGGCGCPGR